MKKRCIYSQKLMAYLVLHEHPLRGVGRDKKDPRFMVYFFDEVDGLDETILDYKKEFQKEK